MLEVIKFNNKLFRYRSESKEQGVIYNLRYGTIYIVKGNTKKAIEWIISQDDKTVNADNKVIDYLIQKEILLRKAE